MLLSQHLFKIYSLKFQYELLVIFKNANDYYMNRTGAIGALLDIYEKAIEEFKEVIKDIPADHLTVVVDAETLDESCRSLQSILSHVVHAGFGYATFIKNLKGSSLTRPVKSFHTTVTAYVEDLSNIFAYTQEVLSLFSEEDIYQDDAALKIQSNWGQIYDVEQMMEHAIVHILRHTRQIKNIKCNQFTKPNLV